MTVWREYFLRQAQSLGIDCVYSLPAGVWLRFFSYFEILLIAISISNHFPESIEFIHIFCCVHFTTQVSKEQKQQEN
jgi:hypothetical protein